MIVVAIFFFEHPTLKIFLICTNFFINFNLFVFTKFVLMKKCITSLAVIAAHDFFINNSSC